MSGWMSTAGEREWSIVNVEDETRTAAREKISQEELIVTKGRMKGTNNSLICLNKFKNLFACGIQRGRGTIQILLSLLLNSEVKLVVYNAAKSEY